MHTVPGRCSGSRGRTPLTYDPLTRELHKVLANGMTVSHTYDPAGRETLLENRRSDGLGLAVYTATYDPVGNRLNVEELDGVRVTYGYDNAYQLVNEQRSGEHAYNITYVYDPVGNRLQRLDADGTTAYQYSEADELLLITPPAGLQTTQTWDANGNLLTRLSGESVTTYTWDGENRLVETNTDGQVDTYTYSAQGKRRKQSTSAGVKLFTWCGENVLIEADTDLAVQARYTDFPGVWGGLSSQRRNGTTIFYGFDLQASTRVLVGDGSAVTDRYLFTAFGEEIEMSGATDNPFRYVGALGYYRDHPTRLYVRARHLDVHRGRWLSQDPLAFDSDPINLYRYAVNQPLLHVDPSGLGAPVVPIACFSACAVVGLAALTAILTCNHYCTNCTQCDKMKCALGAVIEGLGETTEGILAGLICAACILKTVGGPAIRIAKSCNRFPPCSRCLKGGTAANWLMNLIDHPKFCTPSGRVSVAFLGRTLCNWIIGCMAGAAYPVTGVGGTAGAGAVIVEMCREIGVPRDPPCP